MKQLVLLPLLVVLVACPGDQKPKAATAIPVDTAQKTDLSSVHAAVPAAAPDTFKQRKLVPSGTSGTASGADLGLPDAPPALVSAVEREQSASQFCYTEFGKKSDPALRGTVDMAVTVNAAGVTGARIHSSNWSGAAGNAVNKCLVDRARRAWKLAPGAVSSGTYSVRLSFSGS